MDKTEQMKLSRMDPLTEELVTRYAMATLAGMQRSLPEHPKYSQNNMMLNVLISSIAGLMNILFQEREEKQQLILNIAKTLKASIT